ncbi:CD8A protein, partial [Prunella fulvescens]|nr:CD8A protein [Prunella fulvescens]
MDTSPALLLLLTLAFCEYRHGDFSPAGCPGICGQSLQIKVTSPKLQLGQKLELQCQTDKDHGVSWILQDKSGTLHFIVFISSISRATFGGNQKTSPRFEASKTNLIYRLAVKSFTPQDEGCYFCVMNFNRMLHFSPGQPAFLPATTTVAPSTPGPTTPCGTTEKDSYLKTPDPDSRMLKDLDSFCLTFLWLPLAGLCLLLLQLLATSIMLRRRQAHHYP